MSTLRARTWEAMTDKRQPGVLGSLPRTRPHRRSDKRPAAAAPATVSEPMVSPAEVTPEPKRAKAKPRATGTATPRATGTAKRRATATAKPRAAVTPRATTRTAAATPVGEAKPRRTPAREAAPTPAPVPGTLETAVQAAAELAEIGLQASARALRRTLSRLPRP